MTLIVKSLLTLISFILSNSSYFGLNQNLGFISKLVKYSEEICGVAFDSTLIPLVHILQGAVCTDLEHVSIK